MNLLYFEFSNGIKSFFISNAQLDRFFNYYKNNRIKINKFYGYTKYDNYNEDDIKTIYLVKDFNYFINEKRNTGVYFNIKTLNIEIEEMNFDFDNESDIIITYTGVKFEIKLEKFIFDMTGYDISKILHDTYYQHKYILIDNHSIVTVFSSFDEYLTSQYSKFM